jgi:hypothetical protein
VKVAEVKIGDEFIWCGRIVTVIDILAATGRSKRLGRRLRVRVYDDRSVHSLHYWDDEEVST